MMMTFFYLFLRLLCWIDGHLASVSQKSSQTKSQIETLSYKTADSGISLISTRLVRTKKRDPAVLEAALHNASLSNHEVVPPTESTSTAGSASPTEPIEATKMTEAKGDANESARCHDGLEKVLDTHD